MISACLIVKNEIDYIEECIKCLKPYVDEICVTDTGSTDGTLEILEKYGCSVHHFEWCDNFAKARNYCIERAKYDWILSIDADEHIRSFDIDEVKAFAIDENVKKIGNINMVLPTGNMVNVSNLNIPRFFNRNFLKFDRAIHEYLVPVNKYFIAQYVDIPISAFHYGYLDEVFEKKSKNEKYEKMLIKCLDEKYDPYLQRHLVGSYFNLGKFDEAIAEANKFLEIKENNSYFFFTEVVTLKLRALGNLKKHSDAIKLASYFDRCKDDDEYMVYMAREYVEMKDAATALDIYQFLLNKPKLNFSRIIITINVADIFFNYGFYEDALTWYEKVNLDNNIANKIEACKAKLNEQNS